MLKIGKKTSDSQETESVSAPKNGGGNWFKKNQHIVAIGAILLIAFLIRFIDAAGLCIGNDYALSGGTSASEHLHRITNMLTGGAIFGLDGALNYPFGSADANPPLMDLIMGAFAFILNACGMSASAAAGASLAWGAVIFGTFAVIPAYLLGKEILESKVAGYLTAVFVALCPIAISQTVFSNGTEIGFVMFFTLFMFYFLFKGIKAMDNGESTTKYMVLTAVFSAIVSFSWIGARSLYVTIILMMVVQLLIGRFKGRELMSTAIYYSVPVLVGTLVATIFYAINGLLVSVYLGTLLMVVISLVFCVLFAALKEVPWTITIPAFVVGAIVLFVALSFIAPGIFGDIVGGISGFVGTYATLISTTLGFSTVATYFGFVTMWFGLCMALYRIYILPKNIDSRAFVSILVWMIVGMLFAITSKDNAAIFACTYAVGFAAVIIWICSRIDFKSYWASIRNADLRTVWKKIIKPAPFLAVVGAVVLILVPNCMYALDAGVANNDSSNPAFQGSVNYFVKTSDDYAYNDFFSHYKDVEGKGGLVTWLDYSADAATFGNFNVVTDNRGNGTSAMANILLSNGSNGSTVAAMLYYLVTYVGVDECKTILGSNYDEIKKIIENPSDYREDVITNTDRYGIVSSNISDENVSYLSAVAYLRDNNTSYEISEMYDKLSAQSGKDITYVMASGELIPISYGSETTFIELAMLNGYAYSVINEKNYSYVSVPQFYSAGSLFTSYAVYDFTESLTNTFLWRAYVGMSPAEAGFSGSYASVSYISALSRSDGTYKAVPGYGLANFEVDYSTYYVSYNAADDGSGKWEKMLYTEAIALQEKDGGLINYLAGYPVMMKYISSNSKKVSGTVSISGEKVSGVRVAAFDSEGVQRYTTFTDSNGEYTIVLPTQMFDANSGAKIVYSVGSKNVTGGTQIRSVDYTGQTTVDITVTDVTSLSGKIVTENVNVENYLIEMVGTASGKLYNGMGEKDKEFKFPNIVPDTYNITIKSIDGKITYATKSYTTAIGANDGLSIDLDKSKITLTVKDEAGNLVKDISVGIKSGSTVFKGTTDEKGVATFYASAGKYTYEVFTKGYVTITDSTLDVEKSKEKSGSFSVVTTKDVKVEGAKSGFIYGNSYNGSFTDGVAKLPVGLANEASYTIYSVDKVGEGAKVSWATTNGSDVTLTPVNGYVITGKLKSGSDGVTGKITFIADDGKRITVSADSNNGYTAILPAGTYDVYAESGSKILMDKLEVKESATKDFEVKSGKTISGNVYWYSSSYKLQFATIKIDLMIDDKKNTVYTSTDANGKYSYVVPTDAKYKITAMLEKDGQFYFEDPEDKEKKVYEKSLGDNESGDFTTKVDKITIVNKNDFTIKVEGKEIEKDKSLEFDYKSTSFSVSVDYATGYYFSGNVYILPTDRYEMKVDAKEYRSVTFTDVSSTDVISVTAAEDGKYHKDSQQDGKALYYFQVGDKYTVKVTDADKKKIAYLALDINGETKDGESLKVELADSANIKGYVGIGGDGTITFDSKDIYKFDVKSGRYDVVMPVGEHSIAVDVTNNDHVYNGTFKKEFVAGNNVFNMAVLGGELKDDTSDVSMKLDIIKMSEITENTQRAKITFKADITVAEGNKSTYLLSGGSDWFNVIFYSDEGLTQQITSVNDKATIYGEGMIKVSKVASCSENLSVILKDLNGKEVCKGTFTEENWQKTTPKDDSTKVNYGKDKVNEAEYMYSIDVVNGDNFKKTFKAKVTDTFDLSKYVVTFLYGDKVSKAIDNDGKAIDVTMEVNGYSTLTVYVKVTLINGESSDIKTMKVNTEINFVGDYKVTTDEESGVAITGTNAKVVSEHLDAFASVKLSADGRGLINEKSSIPAYVWILVAAILVMLVLIVWLGIRRGVFTRKN